MCAALSGTPAVTCFAEFGAQGTPMLNDEGIAATSSLRSGKGLDRKAKWDEFMQFVTVSWSLGWCGGCGGQKRSPPFLFFGISSRALIEPDISADGVGVMRYVDEFGRGVVKSEVGGSRGLEAGK